MLATANPDKAKEISAILGDRFDLVPRPPEVPDVASEVVVVVESPVVVVLDESDVAVALPVSPALTPEVTTVRGCAAACSCCCRARAAAMASWSNGIV